jgi:HSP20 family molecular chaperone IbpA
MMSFYPRSFCAPAAAEASFVPLFRLLEDFDAYARQAQAAPAAQACRRQRVRQPRQQLSTFNPRFDVRETEHSYELHGELPGLERENVNIEFTQPQTIVIRGRVERTYAPEPTATAEEAAAEPAAESTAETAPAEPAEPAQTEERRHSHQATVEDDPEDENTPASSRAASPWTEVAKPTAEEKPAAQEVTKPAAPAETQDQSRYWRWERSVGEFSRTFSFPSRVDHDAVTATFNNGILSVTVPKAKKMATRKIEIGF